MTVDGCFAEAQRYLQSCSPAGLTVKRFDIVDDVAELTVAFTPEALERVLASELRATGGPTDWDDPEAPMEPGSPTWAHAMELAAFFNDDYFSQVLLARHEAALGAILAAHGHEGTPVVARPDYTPAALMLCLRALKAQHLRGPGPAAPAVHAA
ncbi:hypothetical protein [Kocuria sp.]|jgi:hypothetical protein|uniref:hypothetical protein n=1 Tax=Kocuria sp. TaxID=1871328 RepID=UPI002811F8C0|nr:hypothetical protein [Kocuria sp.]HST71964.1 hypothetical protein [Kocuria rosea]